MQLRSRNKLEMIGWGSITGVSRYNNLKEFINIHKINTAVYPRRCLCPHRQLYNAKSRIINPARNVLNYSYVPTELPERGELFFFIFCLSSARLFGSRFFCWFFRLFGFGMVNHQRQVFLIFYVFHVHWFSIVNRGFGWGA